ncbi:MAG: DUF971 domain-containing protein [Gammaproteobacteria bacterium]|nr:DUF971 domain-containing protein [Gammaproteobacteria bacterium]
MASYHPAKIILHQSSRILEIEFNNGDLFKLPCEYLRVFSPSAEVRAHTGEVSIWITGKEQVNIKKIQPIGQYAIKLFFDDGHNSGLFDWDMLHTLGKDYEKKWQHYLTKCESMGVDRNSG